MLKVYILLVHLAATLYFDDFEDLRMTLEVVGGILAMATTTRIVKCWVVIKLLNLAAKINKKYRSLNHAYVMKTLENMEDLRNENRPCNNDVLSEMKMSRRNQHLKIT